MDDIETLREFIKHDTLPSEEYCATALTALERMEKRLSELQRVAVQGKEMAKEQMDRCVIAEKLLKDAESERDSLREKLADAYKQLSGKGYHASDCATSNAPAMAPELCDCDAPDGESLRAKLAKARETLEPFAKLELWTDTYPDGPINATSREKIIEPLWIQNARSILAELSTSTIESQPPLKNSVEKSEEA